MGKTCKLDCIEGDETVTDFSALRALAAMHKRERDRDAELALLREVEQAARTVQEKHAREHISGEDCICAICVAIAAVDVFRKEQIMLAVNAHDALVAALQEIATSPRGWDDRGDRCSECTDMRGIAKNALAAAGVTQ
jgi:hypothetical protein